MEAFHQFTKFIKLAALTSSQVLNFTKLSSDIGVSANTIKEYYQILQDTLIGFIVPPWSKSIKRKSITTAKFYYFDVGVKNYLTGINEIIPGTDFYGQSFEHFIAQELRAYLSYMQLDEELSYWKTKEGIEVNFVIGNKIAIEVKAANKLSSKHVKNLLKLKDEGIIEKYVLVSNDKHTKHIADIDCLHWEEFLKLLWENSLF